MKTLNLLLAFLLFACCLNCSDYEQKEKEPIQLRNYFCKVVVYYESGFSDTLTCNIKAVEKPYFYLNVYKTKRYQISELNLLYYNGKYVHSEIAKGLFHFKTIEINDNPI